MLAGPHIIDFLRILQKLSNILHPSRQNWTTDLCYFLQKEDNSCKYLSQLLLTSYFFFLTYLVCLNGKFLSVPYILPPWCYVTLFILYEWKFLSPPYILPPWCYVTLFILYWQYLYFISQSNYPILFKFCNLNLRQHSSVEFGS